MIFFELVFLLQISESLRWWFWKEREDRNVNDATKLFLITCGGMCDRARSAGYLPAVCETVRYNNDQRKPLG